MIEYHKNPKMLGSINCTSKPSGAEIFLNDSLTLQTTPYQLSRLIPGEYKIKFRAEGCMDDSVAVIVESNKVVPASRILEDTTDWVSYTMANSDIPSDYLTSMAVDEVNGKVWVGTLDAGVAYLADRNWYVFNTSNSPLPSNKINGLALGEQGYIWIATDAGLLQFNGGIWNVFNSRNSPLPDDYIESVRLNPNTGEVWLATRKGLIVYKGYSWEIYDSDHPDIEANWVLDVAFEKDNDKWVATLAYGLAKLNNKREWTYYTKRNSYAQLKGDYISAIFVDSKNIKWIGWLPRQSKGDLGGLCRFNDTR